MLYYSWYEESNDLLGGFSSFGEQYDHVKSVMYTMKQVEDMQIDDDSRPEHAWCQLALNTEDHRSHTEQQGEETLTGVPEQDLLDNANLLKSYASGLSYRFEAAQVIPSKEYRKIMRGLNIKHLCVVKAWAKKLMAKKSSKNQQKQV